MQSHEIRDCVVRTEIANAERWSSIHILETHKIWNEQIQRYELMMGWYAKLLRFGRGIFRVYPHFFRRNS